MSATGTEHRPHWTTGQLAIGLGVNFGFTRTKRPNSAASAEALGVSESTVRRWLHGPAGSTPPIGDDRLTQIIEALRPPQATYTAQAIALQKAEASLKQIRRAPRRGVLKTWRADGWLHPYLVVIVDPFDAPVQQVTVSGQTEKALDHLSRRGKAVLETTVRNKFAALILTHKVLTQLDWWRIHVPATWRIDGRTQCWIPGAPLPDLDKMASQLKLR